jgi:hypothetical protein
MILVGAMVAAVAMTGPAVGGVALADEYPPPASGDVNFVNPSGQVVAEHHHGAGAEFGLGIASSVLGVLYHPIRMVYGIVGAELGGIAGFTTGGDMRAAKDVWHVTTEGHYFMRPDYLDGTERFRFEGAEPAGRPEHVERVTHVQHSEARVVVPEPAPAPAPQAAHAPPVDIGGDDPL